MKTTSFMTLSFVFLGWSEIALSQAILPCNPLPDSPKDAKKCLFKNILPDPNLYPFLRLKGRTGDLGTCELETMHQSYFADTSNDFETSVAKIKEKNIKCTFDSSKSRYLCTVEGIPGCYVARDKKGKPTTVSEAVIDSVSGSFIKMSPQDPKEDETT